MRSPRALLSLCLLALIGAPGCAALGIGGHSRPDPSDPEEWAAWQAAQHKRAIHERNLILGMSPEDVKRVWGDPGDVALAGSMDQGNQRWTYFEGPSSSPLSTERVIYFEDFRVVGWERH